MIIPGIPIFQGVEEKTSGRKEQLTTCVSNIDGEDAGIIIKLPP
jgi:hypothetical protein